jgi:uncharacterized protein (UPF0303 family)
MSNADDIRMVKEQEKALILASFDEAAAFAIGSALRDRGLREGLGIVADVRTWGRPLFYAALPGSTGDNPDWVRRKVNVVQRMLKASYRVVLEKSFPEDYFPPRRGLDNQDYALAGGGFPIHVKGAGIIGAVTVSGLPDRDDHRLVVDALADYLGLDKTSLTLPPV